MFMRSLTLLGLTAIVAAAATPVAAQPCCSCGYVCAQPAPPAPPPPPAIQIWGLTPSYGVIQGPVYTGPGYYTGPTYQTEVSTAEFPYAGSSDFFDAGPNVDPFRNNLYHPYWPMLRGFPPRRYHQIGSGAMHRRALITRG
jgi:hypothetical protein